MAFNWQTFRTRALTSIVFVVVMLTGLLWNQWSFLVLFSIIHFGCWWEYLRLLEKIHQTRFHNYTKMGLMVIGYGLMLWFCRDTYTISGYGLKENISLPVSAAGFTLLLIGIFQKESIKLKALGVAALGLLYISLSWGLMIWLGDIVLDFKENEWYRIVPIVLIAAIWINDTMAYIVGSLIGKTPMSKISPRKTWEGTVGGALLCVAVISLIGYFVYPFNSYKIDEGSISIQYWIAIAVIAALFGTLGDLLESKLKRMANLKDSGSLMPGHGGFLDRFDSLLLATPFVWIYFYLLAR